MYASAQQLPYYTQNKNNAFMLNPAVTGTKRLVDVRMNYRLQYAGMEDAPRTYSLSAHSRFMKGKMGAGLYLMQDKFGPSKQLNLGASYAFHIRFPDVEFSAGLAGNFTNYTLIGDKIFLHNTQDPAINQTITNSTWVPDASAGVYLYNDRFHVGLAALHMMQSTAEFYKNDTAKKGLIKYATQANFTLGYNYAQNPDFIWESTLYGNYTAGSPLMLDYTLRLHYQEKMFAGVSVRLRDAIALHLGVTIMDDFQVSYSYDIQIGKLKGYNNGSHEIMLVFSSNIIKQRHGVKGDKFLRQKYGYLF